MRDGHHKRRIPEADQERIRKAWLTWPEDLTLADFLKRFGLSRWRFDRIIKNN